MEKIWDEGRREKIRKKGLWRKKKEEEKEKFKKSNKKKKRKKNES